jgi:hypothetical protein
MWLVPNRTINVTQVVSNLPMNDLTGWGATTSYALGARVQRARRIYQSTIAANLGTDPALVDQSVDAPVWLADGLINAVRCFDGVLANKLTATRGAAVSAEHVALGVDATLTACVLDFPMISGENIVTLFGLDAARVRVIGVSDIGVVVYNRVVVTAGRWVTSWWDYFTGPLLGWRRIQAFDGLPLTVTRLIIALEGESVTVGEVTVGRGLYIGHALAEGTGANGRTASYFEINEFGRATYVQRPTRRDVTYSVDISRLHFEKVEGLISDMTGGLVTGIGNVDRPTSVACGIMGEIEWLEDQVDAYVLKFTIKGIT